MSEHVFKTIVAGLCGYEVAAICSGGKLPTLTALDKDKFKRMLGPVLLGGLTVHFYYRWPKKDT